MARASFELEIEIPAPRARLHAFLCDLRNHLELHPLIVGIDEIAPSDEWPSARRYRIVDRVPIGPLRMRAEYVAAVEGVSENEIRAEAWQSPGVHLTTRYTLEDRGERTHLVERVRIDAPFVLRGFVKRQAEQAHRETLEKMRAHFAAKPDRAPAANREESGTRDAPLV